MMSALSRRLELRLAKARGQEARLTPSLLARSLKANCRVGDWLRVDGESAAIKP